MTNIMTSVRLQVKTLVSKKKRRYVRDTFNLDLSYITDNIIAMGYPSIKMEGYYRNHIDEVIRFFEVKHKDLFRVYNLCSERHYDHRKFNYRVAEFPFHDHNPPHIEQIEEFCVDTHQFLSERADHVVAIHCKAGKGRTGTMICCYLLHAGTYETADKALEVYGNARTHDGKGVTIPSQRRYVNYYANIIRYNLKYERIVMQLAEIRMTHCPHLTHHSSSVHFSISFVADSKETLMYSAELPDVKRTLNAQGQLVIQMTECMPLAGDIKVELFHKAKMMRKKHILLRFWFNTFFVCESLKSRPGRQPQDKPHRTQCYQDAELTDIENSEFVLEKDEVDFVHKDKRHRLFPTDFQVFVRMRRTAPGPEPMVGSQQQAEHVRAGNGGPVTLARTTDDSQSTEASSSSSSGGSTSASGGSSSTGEDWESETHKSHPIDTNSTTSTITTQSATTTTNNNNINNNNSISQQQQQQEQQQQPAANRLPIISSHQRVHRVEQHRPPPPPPPPRQQQQQQQQLQQPTPPQPQLHHNLIETHRHHHFSELQHHQLHLSQLSQHRSAPASTTTNPLAAGLSLAAISTASSAGSDDHSICCNRHRHLPTSGDISALIADAADADPDAQSSPSTSSSSSTDDEYDEVFEPTASLAPAVVAGWQCPRATTVVVRTTSDQLQLQLSAAQQPATATVASTGCSAAPIQSGTASPAAAAPRSTSPPAPPPPPTAAAISALAAPPPATAAAAAAVPQPTPISMMLTRVTSSISKSSSVCSALFRSKRRSKAAAAAAATTAAAANSDRSSPVLGGGGNRRHAGAPIVGGPLLMRQSSGPVQLQSVTLSPPVTPPTSPTAAEGGSSGSNLSSTSSAGITGGIKPVLVASSSSSSSSASGSGSNSEDDGGKATTKGRGAARGTRGTRGGGGGGGVRGGAKMLAYLRRNFSRRRST